MTLAEILISSGLGLDILGAGLIAVPDIPLANRYLKSGRLKIGRNFMESGGVTKGSIGFEEITQVLNQLEPVDDFSNDGGEPVEIAVNSRGGFTSDRIKESPMNWGEEYVEHRYEKEAELDDIAVFGVGDVYKEIRNRIEPQVTALRGGGFLILAFGFFLQFVGTLL